MNIDQIIDNIFPLPEDSKIKLKAFVEEVTYAKGTILLRAEKVETSLYFIKKGMVRAYADSEKQEITFWFGKEGDTAISMKSYVQHQKGYESIELIEVCQLYEIKAQDLQNLFFIDIQIANWGRKLVEKELIKTEERLISQLFQTASQRYRALIRDHPDLLQRVSLGHIASYLGVTQASLSRIRSEYK
jgi:CRP-like cAMP-binding protein